MYSFSKYSHVLKHVKKFMFARYCLSVMLLILSIMYFLRFCLKVVSWKQIQNCHTFLVKFLFYIIILFIPTNPICLKVNFDYLIWKHLYKLYFYWYVFDTSFYSIVFWVFEIFILTCFGGMFTLCFSKHS